MVQVAEGVGLHLGVFGLADACAEAIGGPGGVPGVQQPGDQGQHRADGHFHAGPPDLPHVPVGHPLVDDVAHQDGDHHFKGAFHHHQQHPQGHVPPVGPHIAEEAFQIVHAISPQKGAFACYNTAKGESQAEGPHSRRSAFQS